MTKRGRIGTATIGRRISINKNSLTGRRTFGIPVPPPITPEYWWRADSGLSTSGWTASNGGLNFTFTNVSSADSTNGVLFDGSSGFGLSTNPSTDVDVTHAFIRFDSFTGTNRTLLGGSHNETTNILYGGVTGNMWRSNNTTVGGLAIYDVRTNTEPSTFSKAIWFDYVNGTNLLVTPDQSDTSTQATTNGGTFVPYFRYYSGYGIYLARGLIFARYANMYVKEVALFTRSLTVAQAKEFRTEMFTRWP